jgi:hypothetical protein
MLNELRSVMGKLKSVEELFKGRHFDRGIVILCVRWYLRFKLSLRDLVEMMAERGLSMAHTTIMRWVQRYAPEFEKRSRRFAPLAVMGAAYFVKRQFREAAANLLLSIQGHPGSPNTYREHLEAFCAELGGKA